jgi:hypothetical protein
MPRPGKKPGTESINTRTNEINKELNAYLLTKDKHLIDFLLRKIAKLELELDAIRSAE